MRHEDAQAAPRSNKFPPRPTGEAPTTRPRGFLREVLNALAYGIDLPNVDGRMRDQRLDRDLLSEIDAAPPLRVSEAREAKRKRALFRLRRAG